MGTSEHEIQQQILLALGQRRDLRIWRQNGGLAVSGDGNRAVRFGVPGCADLSGLLMGGRRLELEVKAPGGRLSEQQASFRTMIERFGGLYIVSRSVDEAVAAIEAAAAPRSQTVAALTAARSLVGVYTSDFARAEAVRSLIDAALAEERAGGPR